MARKVRRSFKSARTDVRKRPKHPVARKVKSRAQKVRATTMRLDRRAKKAAKQTEIRETKVTSNLRIPNRCQCLLDGKFVWAKAKDKNGKAIRRDGKIVRYPVIVNAHSTKDDPEPAIRCESVAVSSKRRNNQTVHRCAQHVGVWYVDVDGVKKDFDNQVV